MPMIYRKLGNCGTRVSLMGLGSWLTYGGSVSDIQKVKAIHTKAFEAGINFIDTADVYSEGRAEAVMGEVLSDHPRHTYVLSSKVFFPVGEGPNDRGLSRKHIRESIDRSLKRLKTEYLDIYFCHRFDSETPLEETVRAMDDLVRQGKILYWGTSQWTNDQLREAHQIARDGGWAAPQVEQPQYSLLRRSHFETETEPAAKSTGMGTTVWSPLASGILTGKYDSGIPADSRLAREGWLKREGFEKDVEKSREFKKIAEELGVSRSVLALAWVAKRPTVSSLILGVTSEHQLEENLRALQYEMDEKTYQRLSELFSWN